MDDIDINDIRSINKFRGQTFSGYKSSEVKLALIKQLKNENVNGSLFWCFELLCSGNINIIWEIFIIFIGAYISISNPKLIIYCSLKMKEFNNLYKNGYINNELLLRNNNTCRNLLAEVIYILASSPKKPCLEKLKIIKDTDFILENISSKLKAPETKYIDDIFKEDDPLEIYIPLNEFSYSLNTENKNRNLWESLYWLEWIIQYEKIAKDKDIKIISNYRNILGINENFKKDYIWILWDIILYNSKKDHLQYKTLYALLELFSNNYKPGYKQKKKPIMYTAIEFIINFDNVRFKEPIIKNKDFLLDKDDKINKIIKIIKNNEISPKTDYLFNNIEGKSEAEKTIEKLNKLQDLL